MYFFSLLFFSFCFFFFFCFGDNHGWHLNHSVSVDSSSAHYEPITSNYIFSLDLSVSLANPGSSDFYAFLCFVSPSLLPVSYILSICMTANFTTPVIVWSANRGNPVREENASVTFDSEGNLLLQGGPDGGVYWATKTSNKGVVRMELSQQFPVNLILFDSNNKTIWQSVDYPTDTLTFNQSLKQGVKLVSRASFFDPSEGNYSLVLEDTGMTLYYSPGLQPYSVIACGDNPPQDSKCSIVTFKGYGFLVDNNSPLGSINLSVNSLLRLDPDGNLRIYSIFNRITIMYEFFEGLTQCNIPMFCGPYGVCKDKGQCTCPDQTSLFVQPNGNSQSCDLVQHLQISCLPNNNNNNNTNTDTNSSRNLQMLEYQGLHYFSNASTSPLLGVKTEEECKDKCLHNCSCHAAFWHDDDCFHVDHMEGLLGYEDPKSYQAFLKVDVANNSSRPPTNLKLNYVIGVVSGLGALLLLSSLLYGKVRLSLQRKEEKEEEEAIMDSIPGLPTCFSYKDLYLATNGFSDKLGQGGFGTVYAGTFLSNGIATKVAVKQLEGVRQGDKEFRSEVAIMGGIHHFNLLRLLGFCAQGSHRLLVYEYMKNGSLDQCLFIKHQDTMKTPLPWDVRCRIAVGVARGFAYLHDDCRGRIIHLDIKPQNILLDESFKAKVADFGLSRLMEKDKSHVITTMRGTPGYLAPEWLKEGPIDHKCDVFSFGMLLFEIISGRKNLDYTMESHEQTYYPEWAFWQAQKGNDISDLTDAKIESEEERIKVKRMINTAFLCVLEEPSLRPSMEKVVQMLEGHVPVSHIDLSTLYQGLLFVLRNPSNVRRTQIEEAVVNILASSPTTNIASCSANVSSFYVSVR